MKEVWKDIPNYEGLYEISDFGRVRSLYTNKILKPSIDRYGYARFSATKNKTQKTLRVHRLVMEVFAPRVGALQVNHKDGIKLNNRLDNLEWCTDSENKIHAYELGLMTSGNQYKQRPKQDLPRYKTRGC